MADPAKPVEQDDWVDVPSAPARAPAGGDDWTTVAPKSPIDPNSPEALAPPPGSAPGRLAQGFWANTGAAVTDAAKAIWDLNLVAAGQKKELDPSTKQIWGNVVKAHHDQAEQARKAWEKGEHVEAAGHAAATILPLVGPMAAHAGERMGSYQPATFDKYGNVIQQGQSPDVAGGIGESLGMVFPSVAARIPAAAGKVVRAIPSTVRAGAAFDQVMQAAGHLPIDVTAPGQAALDAQRLAQAGGQMPKVMRDFLNRVTKPNSPPLSFQEARDFYSNATRLSADEFNRLTPVMKRQVGQFTKDLDSSLAQTAGRAGAGDAYRSAMQEWRKAMKLRSTMKDVKKVVKSDLAKGIGIGAGGAGLGYLYNQLWGKAEGGPIHERPYSRGSIVASLKRGH